MSSGLTSHTLMEELKLESSGVEIKPIGSTDVQKFFVYLTGQLNIILVVNQRTTGTTTHVISTDVHVALELDSWQKIWQLRLEKNRRFNDTHLAWGLSEQ